MYFDLLVLYMLHIIAINYYSLVSNNVRGRTVRACVCACVRDVFAIYDNNII